MKTRLNITVDEVLIKQAKRYAARHNTSLSHLIEEYLKNLTNTSGKKNVLGLLNEFPKPKRKVPEGDMKKHYYESRKKKYGF